MSESESVNLTLNSVLDRKPVQFKEQRGNAVTCRFFFKEKACSMIKMLENVVKHSEFVYTRE